jgi:L-threonylcarbamoyladenylate synthase
VARLTPADADALERCLAAGGVAVFPSDTVYGLACDPESPAAVERLYRLKGRPQGKPAAVMFLSLERARAVLDDLGPRLERALARLLPGPVTVLLPNPTGRFPLACGDDRETLGVRVPALSGDLAALAAVRAAVLQSSANLSGGADPRRLEDVEPNLHAGADLALDGGELPGIPSTVIDLRGLEGSGRWEVLREGALSLQDLATALGPE